VSTGFEALAELSKGAVGSSLGEEIPGALNHGKASVAHISLSNCQLQPGDKEWFTYLKAGHEFAHRDSSVLVVVEVVVDSAEFLGREEDSEFGKEGFEFELFEDLVSVLVEALKSG
jgi:hypothetical protein